MLFFFLTFLLNPDVLYSLTAWLYGVILWTYFFRFPRQGILLVDLFWKGIFFWKVDRRKIPPAPAGLLIPLIAWTFVPFFHHFSHSEGYPPRLWLSLLPLWQMGVTGLWLASIDRKAFPQFFWIFRESFLTWCSMGLLGWMDALMPASAPWKHAWHFFWTTAQILVGGFRILLNAIQTSVWTGPLLGIYILPFLALHSVYPILTILVFFH